MSDKLVRMANQIGSYFKIQPEKDAITGIAQHLKMYWTPRMRHEIVACLDGGGAELMPIVRSAIEKLREEPVPIEKKFPG